MKNENEEKKDYVEIAQEQTDNPPSSMTRRRFLGNVGGTTATIGLAAGIIGIEPILGSKRSVAQAVEIGPEGPVSRLAKATEIRINAAFDDAAASIPFHPTNGDEELFPNKIGTFTKNLRHHPVTGEVILSSYNAWINALKTGKFSDFEALVTNGHFGCPDPTRQRRLVNPFAGYAFDLETRDSHQFLVPAPPRFSSAEEAGEMAELYWMALLRDVNFNDYATNPLALAAAADLSGLSDFRGPKIGGQVTPQTLFRDTLPGCTNGPYVSQFLLQNCPYGAQRIDQRMATTAAGVNFMTDFPSWLDVQNGCRPTVTLSPGGLFFCRNGRDLGQYVHIDALYQAYQVATLMLLSLGLPWDQNNPYGQTPDGGAGLPLPVGTPGSKSMTAFGTFGGPYILALVCEVSFRALKSVWFTKWLLHRRLRPEEFGGRVEVERLGLANYPIHSDLANSTVLNEVFSQYGTYLLPMAFPEGSPIHPSYGAGHATVAGACVTILKAFFDESAIIPNPVMTNPDGSGLDPYIGAPLTVGGELNKVASNIATGRNIAGVHWRSDAAESFKLGEAVAISLLKNQRATYRESFNGFKLTKFDGTTITV
jgi:hypothetical protein